MNKMTISLEFGEEFSRLEIRTNNLFLNRIPFRFNLPILGEARRLLVISVAAFLAITLIFFIPVLIKELSSSENYNKSSENDEHRSAESKTSARIAQWMNTTVDPCLDFYEFVFGNWITEQKKRIAEEGQKSITQFTSLAVKTEIRIQDILNDVENSGDSTGLKKARLFFNSCVRSEDEPRSSSNAELKLFIKELFGVHDTFVLESSEFAGWLGRTRRELGEKMISLNGPSRSYYGGDYLFSTQIGFNENAENKPGNESTKYSLKISPATLFQDNLHLKDSLFPLLQNFTIDAIVRSWTFLEDEFFGYSYTETRVLEMANRFVDLDTAYLDMVWAINIMLTPDE